MNQESEDAPIRGNVDSVPAYGSSLESTDERRSASDAALENVVNEPTMQSDVGAQARTNAAVGPTDAEQLPPTSSARSQVVNDAGGGEIGS